MSYMQHLADLRSGKLCRRCGHKAHKGRRVCGAVNGTCICKGRDYTVAEMITR